MKTKKKFTLIELLVVISIIAVLAGLILPALSKVRTQAKKAKARAQMRSFEIAAKSYESTYGMTVAATTDVTESDSANSNYGKVEAGSDAYKRILEVLTCVDYPGTGSEVNINPRNVRFLDVADKYETQGFKDPWGKEFVLFFDVSYAGFIKVGSTKVYRNVALYSFGTNATDNGGAKETGDLLSWEEF